MTPTSSGGDPTRRPSIRNLSHSWMPWGGHSTDWSHDGGKLFVPTGSADAMQFNAVAAPRK
ncbi:hypothetical protein GCM10010259_32770 [Streptomyces daghestanicus]|uniref:Uncharacterized protein n=1 Tax=Streptomyces daghestanicus TaxID=66885 RepID=A0ABQ3Q0N6_9ACTN|nr:hypothetical protein GCM10010259_32770 [Streptomyces daghestanicus]GHI30836.1 hypothetical protein Sdagh_25660 [Streptomyces daghestanicus]